MILSASLILLIAFDGPLQKAQNALIAQQVKQVLAGDDRQLFVLRKLRSVEKERCIVQSWSKAKTSDVRLSLVIALGAPTSPQGKKLLNACANQSKDWQIQLEALRTLHRFEEAKKVKIPSNGPPLTLPDSYETHP